MNHPLTNCYKSYLAKGAALNVRCMNFDDWLQQTYHEINLKAIQGHPAFSEYCIFLRENKRKPDPRFSYVDFWDWLENPKVEVSA